MADKQSKSSKKGSQKTFASKRTMNPSSGGGTKQVHSNTKDAFQEQDAARRLGGFEGAGEHARTGNRGHQ